MIRQLRKKENYDDVYVNYLAFQDNDMCSTIKVWIDELNGYASHTALICYVRQAITEDDRLNKTPPYTQIALFPETTHNMMIFVYNPKISFYNFVDIIENIRWVRYKNIDPVVFGISVPKSYNINAMYNELHGNVQNLTRNKYVKIYLKL